jgi:aspartate aminotransferase-like enzyme
MNYPNMSYCMCENTLLALRQVLNAMEDQGTEFVQDMNRSERRAFEELFHACEAFMQQAEQLESDIAEQNEMVAENDYED